MNYEPGMLLSFCWETGSVGICKVIKVTESDHKSIVSISVFSNAFADVPESLTADQLKPMIAHMPMTLPGLAGCAAVGRAEIRSRELEALQRWLEAWQAGKAGVFTKSVGDAVSQIMEAMLEV